MAEENLIFSGYETLTIRHKETKTPQMHSHWKQQAVSGQGLH